MLASSVALTLSFSGCASMHPATARTFLQDAASPAGQSLLEDVTRAALRVGLDLAAGRDGAAALAGVQGAASAVRDYEGLPVAPASTTVAQAAAAGAGVARVAATLTPAVRTLLDDARRTAARQHVHVTTDDLIEALARGLDAVAVRQSPTPSPTQP